MKAKLMMMGVVAAVAMGAMADNTVRVTKFHQSFPYTGKATVEYTVGGTLSANPVAEITINTGDVSATFVQSNIVTGANSHVIDFAASFGGAMVLTNASFVVTIERGGVQLWENGPYWTECNVGAEELWECGYYFWWGDTVGYTRIGGTLTTQGSYYSYYSGVTWVSSTGEQMSSTPFDYNTCPTYRKSNSELQAAGYIDSTGNLVAAHDAATAHLGAPWRMPTRDEIDALVRNCTTTWITTNGVSGRLVTGKGSYANRSIFLPAAGYGYLSDLNKPGLGLYWSSTPNSDFPISAYYLDFGSGGFARSTDYRWWGLLVRPVRGLALSSTFGIVTYDPLPVTETQTTTVPVPYAWLDMHVPGIAYACEAYEAAAKAMAANGRPVWACYALGLDPQDATSDFRIASFPMKADGTPDFANVAFDPPQAQWNVPDAPVTWKGAAKLEGPWRTARPTMQFFKAVVFGDADGVQLWENGPYWATCNVGTSKPEGSGYYFWWGDTVGYTRSGGIWKDYVNDSSGYYSDVTWVSSTWQQMSSSPFSSSSCPTYSKSKSELQSAGYIDSTGNLVAAHDAATAHLGAPWRTPTDAEFSALIENCTTTWITTNGVPGRLFTGKGEYANMSIFLPATGYGNDSCLCRPMTDGCYWSSTRYFNNSYYSYYAWSLYFGSGSIVRNSTNCYKGWTVRPVRDAE